MNIPAFSSLEFTFQGFISYLVVEIKHFTLSFPAFSFTERPQLYAEFSVSELSLDSFTEDLFPHCTGCPKKKYPDLVDPSDKNIA